MIKWNSIFISLTIFHVLIAVSIPSIAKQQATGPEIRLNASGKGSENKCQFIKKEVFHIAGILKNNKRSLNFKSSGGGSSVYGKLQKSLSWLMNTGKNLYRPAADLLLKKHLVYNYPSHNFW